MKRILVFIAIIVLSACSKDKLNTEAIEFKGETATGKTLSNMKVNVISQDKDGFIWIGTQRGLNRYDSEEFLQFFCNDDNQGLQDNLINDIFSSKDGELWIATGTGAARYHKDRSFDRFHTSNVLTRDFKHILESEDGTIYFEDGFTLTKYFQESDSIHTVIGGMTGRKFYTTPGNEIWSIGSGMAIRYSPADFSKEAEFTLPFDARYSYMLPNGDIWMSNGSQMSIFNTTSRRSIEVPEAIKKEPELYSASLIGMTKVGASLFFCTTSGQLFLYNQDNNLLMEGSDPRFPYERPPFKDISTVFGDSDNNIWFGSNTHGYFVSYGQHNMFNMKKFPVSELKEKKVISLAWCNEENTLVIATQLEGTYLYNKSSDKLYQYPDINLSKVFVDSSGTIWSLSDSGRELASWHISNNKLEKKSSRPAYGNSITEDRKGRIVIGSGVNLMILDTKNNGWTLANLFTGYTNIPAMCVMEDGNLLISAFNKGLEVVDSEGNHSPLDLYGKDLSSFITRSVFVPKCLYKDSDGDIWIATTSNGLLHYTPQNKSMEKIAGVPCSDITAILEDKSGNIWVSTLHGLGKLDMRTKAVTVYFEADGTGGDEFVEDAACALPDGTLVFGGAHGITMFNPVDNQGKRKVPIVFEEFKINNTVVSTDLDAGKQITLKHDQKNFSIKFSALNFSEEAQAHYTYKLEGFDKYWVNAGYSREAYYSNIPAGKYVFKLKANSATESTYSAEIRLPVHVKVNPWFSIWAKVVYLIIFVILTNLAARWFMKHQEIKRVAERSEYERTFFTNIAHEFRSPLTMISGPISMLQDSRKLDTRDRSLVDIIQKNSNWMLQLVGQFLDLGKIDKDKLKLGVRKNDIVELLSGIMEVFSVNAEVKGIKLISEGLDEGFTMPFDADKVYKILTNLMSNAMKFTPQGGSVRLTFDLTPEGYARIDVTDTGCGISEANRKKVFDRYFQNENSSNYGAGTGIGLYYAKELVKLHHGKIWNEANPNGQGTRFTVLIPYLDDAYSQEEYSNEQSQQIIHVSKPALPASSFDPSKKKPLVLAVDDDIDIANYIQLILSEHYDVVSAFNAEAALQKIQEAEPDIIISDVMMPGMDGNELCKAIKNNLQMSHIPVILVTAKTTVDSQVEGLEAGADAYVTKPFEPKYLLALIKSQLEKRKDFQKEINSSTDTEVIEQEETLLPQDKAFLTDLYNIMEEALKDSDIDVNHIADIMKISRTKFYYKVKGLTGESPGVFFKHYKLNRAAELIKEGKNNMSEIADMTGFANLSHFSTSFKKQFGVPPSEYKG